MTLVIGTDEAGYGPNLGPLVIGATAWRVDAAPAKAAEAVAAAAADVSADTILWGDSKAIYRGSGFASLERGALVAATLAAGRVPSGWPELVATLGGGQPPGGEVPEEGRLRVLALPCGRHEPDIGSVATAVARRLVARGVRLESAVCRIIQPREFNRFLATGLNKADVLSGGTLVLAATLAAGAGDEPVVVWCDRHGGRMRYAPVVARAFETTLVRVIHESPTRSAYAVPERRFTIDFTVGGEARLPVAVASMVAKYVRELAMRGFNEHWSSRVPGLTATAGYPLDARRWRRDAEATVRRDRVPWSDVWREA